WPSEWHLGPHARRRELHDLSGPPPDGGGAGAALAAAGLARGAEVRAHRFRRTGAQSGLPPLGGALLPRDAAAVQRPPPGDPARAPRHCGGRASLTATPATS